MALVLEVVPKLPAKVKTKTSITIDNAEDAGDWKFTVSYLDLDGAPFGRPQTFTLNKDGVSLNEVKAGGGKVINWVAPADAEATMAAAVTLVQAALQAMKDANALTP